MAPSDIPVFSHRECSFGKSTLIENVNLTTLLEAARKHPSFQDKSGSKLLSCTQA